MTDLGNIPLDNVDAHGHAVALEGCCSRRNLVGVAAATDVLALQLLFGLVEQAAVKDLALGKPHRLQPLLQVGFVEFLGTVDFDLGDRRAFLNQNDEHAVVDFDADILEKAGRKQRADCLRGFFIGHRVADLDREIAEYGPRLDALDALDADVLDGERIKCAGVKRRYQADYE